jgi:hypothetical protein
MGSPQKRLNADVEAFATSGGDFFAIVRRLNVWCPSLVGGLDNGFLSNQAHQLVCPLGHLAGFLPVAWILEQAGERFDRKAKLGKLQVVA